MAHNHKYDDPQLPALINKGLVIYQQLADVLYEIQQKTGIPGFRTNINSDDDTPGIEERFEYMQESDLADRDLKLFISFDED
jgi:hypothetical protein